METIDDPLDFKNSELQTLDENLRCPICKEFFNTPLILSTCSHSFCAICIRRCLAAEQCCPKCRTSSFESNLHNNYDLDNIVNAWKGTRALLLDLEVKRSESVIVTTMEKLQVEQHNHSNDFVETNSKVSTTRRSTRLKKTSDETEDSSIATCPVCQQKMPVVVINQHVDRCLDGDSRIPALPNENAQSSIMATKKIDPGKKPPRIVYDMYKEKDLKKALRDLDLPDHGDRVQLVWRYKEYVALYNSNMDSDNPKDIKQLLRQLNVSEQIQFSNRMNSKRTLPDVDSHNILFIY
ncbi:hypothetical protein BJ944DRAFT_61276 [Cunninghamella echinulata]|nr:hypothetical protein BJ944DRAFT_61276 [Cunninghamella echinulata]